MCLSVCWNIAATGQSMGSDIRLPWTTYQACRWWWWEDRNHSFFETYCINVWTFTCPWDRVEKHGALKYQEVERHWRPLLVCLCRNNFKTAPQRMMAPSSVYAMCQMLKIMMLPEMWLFVFFRFHAVTEKGAQCLLKMFFFSVSELHRLLHR